MNETISYHPSPPPSSCAGLTHSPSGLLGGRGENDYYERGQYGYDSAITNDGLCIYVIWQFRKLVATLNNILW